MPAKRNTDQKPAAATAEPPRPAKSLFERVAGYLDTQDWAYTAEPEKKHIEFRIRVSEVAVRCIADLDDDDGWERVLVYSVFPVFVREERRAEVAAAINRINHRMVFGNIEMDPDDGEIRIRTMVGTDGEVTQALIARGIESNLGAADRHFAAIMEAAFGKNDIGKTRVKLAAARRARGVTLQ